MSVLTHLVKDWHERERGKHTKKEKSIRKKIEHKSGTKRKIKYRRRKRRYA